MEKAIVFLKSKLNEYRSQRFNEPPSDDDIRGVEKCIGMLEHEDSLQKGK